MSFSRFFDDKFISNSVDNPIVFRLPNNESLTKMLSKRGFSFIDMRHELIAYQPKHWNPGKHGAMGIALEGICGLAAASEDARHLLEGTFTRRDFLKGLAAIPGLEFLRKMFKRNNDTADAGYYNDTADAGYYNDTADAGYYNDTADAGYYNDTADAGYYKTSKIEGRSIVCDLDDINDSWNRQPNLDYTSSIIEACISRDVCQHDSTISMLKADINESRTHSGTFKILLDESEHIEWSVMNKLTKNFDSTVMSRRWTSPIEKLNTLCAESSHGLLRAVAANEALTVGGDKHLMWVDIDSMDVGLVESWLSTQRLFPNGSHMLVTSSTGKSHLYVATDVPLKERWQRSMRQLIRESMPKELSTKLDRVYGPSSKRAIFLPNDGLSRAIAPQRLMASCDEVFRLPVNDIEHVLWRLS